MVARDTLLKERYRIGRLIGMGGMSRVYLAQDMASQQPVAVKVFDQRGDTSAGLLGRFEREIHALMQISHPYIVPLLDYHLTPELAYIVMPYFENGSVADRLAKQLYSPHEAAQVLAQVCFALDHAHSYGYYHMDLKPPNFLLDSGGRVYLTDFGLATPIGMKSSLSEEGEIFGTLAYMAPELLEGAPPDARSEVYALGISLIEVLTGHRPFESDSVVMTMNMHRLGQVPRPSLLNVEMSPALDEVLMQAVSKSPGERPQRAFELADRFSAAVKRLPLEQQTHRAVFRARPVVKESVEDTILFDNPPAPEAPRIQPLRPPDAMSSNTQIDVPPFVMIGLWGGAILVVIALLILLARR